VTPEIAPHVHLGDERLANCNSKRLNTKRNEAAVLVQRVGSSVALYNGVYEHETRTATRVLESRKN
jgi:hypothetical protein